MKIIVYEQTNPGSRQTNQDYFTHIIGQNWGCFVVTDGLGGHDRGEIAAKEFCHAVQHLADKFVEKILNTPVYAIKELIQAAADRMRRIILREYGVIDTQTTFALLWMDPKQLITAHVGDSRIYRLNKQQVIWRTIDHSYAQELLEKGKITAEQFATHPAQSKLQKALSINELPAADIYLYPPLTPAETIVLCTDGFWVHTTEEKFIAIACAQNIEDMVNAFVNQILREHGDIADNITIQVIRVRDAR